MGLAKTIIGARGGKAKKHQKQGFVSNGEEGTVQTPRREAWASEVPVAAQPVAVGLGHQWHGQNDISKANGGKRTHGCHGLNLGEISAGENP